MQPSESHYLYLNTRDRNEGSNNDAVFRVDKRSLPTMFMLTLESIQLPHHMYPFSNERRAIAIYWEENTIGNGLVATLTLDRNYNGTTLASELSDIMSAASANTYTVTYDIDTKRLTISVDAGTFRIISGNNDINYETGFDPFIQADFAASIEAKNPVDLSGTKYIDVVSSMGGGSNYCSTGSYSVLARMPASASFGEVILFEPTLRHSIMGHNSNNTVQMSLRDDRGGLIQIGSNGHVGYSIQIHQVAAVF